MISYVCMQYCIDMKLSKAFLYISILLTQPVFAQRGSIDTTLTLKINGIQQVITFKGNDREAPVLLYLHGAGGNNYSLIDNAAKLTSRLQQHFIVALWDQRDYGKTYQLNQSPQAPTLHLMEDDCINVVDSILKTFNREKLFIAAHSAGCVMGLYTAQKHPELLNALIEISPPVNGIKSQKIRWSTLTAHYKKVNNILAVHELSTVRLPARDFQSLFIMYVWQTEYEGEHISDSVREEIKPVLKNWMQTPAASLSNEVFDMNFGKQYPVIKCPVYFFAGRKDFLTNAALTEQYYKQLKAPKKQLFWFEKSAHVIPDTEPELMQDRIINDILPVNKD